MEPATPTGETVEPGTLSNDGQTAATTVPTAPVVNATDSAEVEKLKKEAEQARIRANQLENELKKKNDADEIARQKQLEEKEEFKTLYEQTQSRLKEIEDAQDAQTKKVALEAATTEVLKGYPANVQDLAKTAGLSLLDDSEESKTRLVATLDAFKEKVGSSSITANPNNPGSTAPVVVNREELTARSHPGGESPMAIASAQGDDSVTRKYISDLSAIKRMKEIANQGA